MKACLIALKVAKLSPPGQWEDLCCHDFLKAVNMQFINFRGSIFPS